MLRRGVFIVCDGSFIKYVLLGEFMKQPSVLFISEYFTPVIHGGGEINLALTAKALAQKGLRVTVLTSWFAGLAHREMVEGVLVLRLLRTGQKVDSFAGNLQRLLFFERSVLKNVPRAVREQDVSIIHLIGSSLGCAKKLRRLQIPIVATIESYIALCPKGDFLYGANVDLSRWSFGRYVSALLQSKEVG